MLFNSKKSELKKYVEISRDISDDNPNGYYVAKRGGWYVIERKGENVLYGCEMDKADGYVNIPYGADIIAVNAFRENSRITEVVISDSVKYISYGAFFGCDNLENVTIPSSVLGIGAKAFWGCDSLKEVKIPRDFDFSTCDGAFDPNGDIKFIRY